MRYLLSPDESLVGCRNNGQDRTPKNAPSEQSGVGGAPFSSRGGTPRRAWSIEGVGRAQTLRASPSLSPSKLSHFVFAIQQSFHSSPVVTITIAITHLRPPSVKSPCTSPLPYYNNHIHAYAHVIRQSQAASSVSSITKIVNRTTALRAHLSNRHDIRPATLLHTLGNRAIARGRALKDICLRRGVHSIELQISACAQTRSSYGYLRSCLCHQRRQEVDAG